MHTPSMDGRAHVDIEAIATVSRHRPDGARLEGNTTFVLDAPSGSRVAVKARARVSAREVTAWGASKPTECQSSNTAGALRRALVLCKGLLHDG